MADTTKRESRTSNERENVETRKKVWQPPSMLETPTPPPGYKYRWLRTEMMGNEDRTNMTKKLREGYELVKPDELDGYLQLPSITEGIHKGFIGVGGLVLAKIPEELVEQRNAYYAQRTVDQQQAIDNDLMKESHSAMPLSKGDINHSSRTSFGSQNTG